MKHTLPIPMSEPDITEDDIEAVVAALRSKRLSIGPYLEDFEKAFASYIGTRFAVGVSSGTAGLHCVIRAAKVKSGDQVITTSFSFVASANCLLYEGAEPVFVDIDEESMNIDPQKIGQAITERTRAILPVHVFGQPCEMDEIKSLARRSNLLVFEDACEALGSQYRGRNVGALGDSAIFGFYPNKQITTGEGGIITTDDPELVEDLRSLRNQGRDHMGTWLRHVQLGYNYRLGEMNAALGLSQLSRVESLISKRNAVARAYCERLEAIEGVRVLRPGPNTTHLSWFVFPIRLDPSICRDSVIAALNECGVPSRAYFEPIHLQPFYRERFGYSEGDLPVTERVAKTALALPFHSNLPEAHMDRVTEGLRSAIQRAAP